MSRLTHYDAKQKQYIRLASRLAVDNKLGKLEDLEEQIGCPLEVREQALTNGIYIKNIYGDMVNFKVMLVYKNKELGYYFRIINDGVVLLKDYKKTWFLKKDRSE